MPPHFLLQSFMTLTEAVNPRDGFALITTGTWSSLFWLQNYFAGLLNFSIFLGIEGGTITIGLRKNASANRSDVGRIHCLKPTLIFAFASLSLISLGFAQNLFYAFLLILPISPRMPQFFNPYWYYYVTPAIFSLFFVSSLPLCVDTWAFYPLVWLCIVVVLVLPQLSYVRLSFPMNNVRLRLRP